MINVNVDYSKLRAEYVAVINNFSLSIVDILSRIKTNETHLHIYVSTKNKEKFFTKNVHSFFLIKFVDVHHVI